MKHAIGLAALAALVSASAFGGAAFARDKDIVVVDEDIRVHKLRDFGEFDQDGDGKISREEYLSGPASRFDKLDANRDGFIDSDERKTVVDRKIGHITEFERERWENLLERFDANDDEMLAKEEILSKTEEKIAEVMERLRERAFHWEHRFEAPLVLGGPLDWHMGRGPAIFARRRLIDELDGNGDGEITEQEYLDARKGQFAKLDRDGDGKLSESELAEFAWSGFAFRFFDLDGIGED
ncbi:MAG TPA: hypothetical protein VD713_05790 [Sphingomonadales bacterium]|nr:hypothetical protein [Sphingomonadales bacterium]